MVDTHEEIRRDNAVLEALGSHRRNLADLTTLVNRNRLGRPLSHNQIRTVLKRLEADARVVIDGGMWESVD